MPSPASLNEEQDEPLLLPEADEVKHMSLESAESVALGEKGGGVVTREDASPFSDTTSSQPFITILILILMVAVRCLLIDLTQLSDSALLAGSDSLDSVRFILFYMVVS